MIEPGAVVSGPSAVFVGAVILGIVHGAEPGHGWPIAATYALDRRRKWAHGFAASFLLGMGHLVSSLAVVGAFFLAKGYFDLERIDEPLGVLGFEIGGPVSLVAGVLLIALGVREYRRGHTHGDLGSHDHGHEPDHGHGRDPDREHDHGHEHEHRGRGHTHDGDGRGEDRSHAEAESHDRGHDSRHTAPNTTSNGRSDRTRGLRDRLVAVLPFVGGHSHDHPSREDLDEKGLAGIVWTAFVLGFVHEEEFEIIGLCAGSDYCLELMVVYAVAVMAALVGLTLLLIAGYYRYEDRVEQYTEHLPTISAVVLVTMGAGFVLGVF